jgi:hypothetical protein
MQEIVFWLLLVAMNVMSVIITRKADEGMFSKWQAWCWLNLGISIGWTINAIVKVCLS